VRVRGARTRGDGDGKEEKCERVSSTTPTHRVKGGRATSGGSGAVAVARRAMTDGDRLGESTCRTG
jgi:hypothetical protein